MHPKKPEHPAISFPPDKSLALCIIAGNVEGYIKRFVESFQKLTPHIFVVRAVGNQTPDRTLEIAQAMGCQINVYYNAAEHADWPHVDDFGRARQMAFEMGMQGGHQLLMWADTDDCIDPESVREIHALIREQEFDCLYLPYRLSNNNLAPVRERIVRAGTFRWQDPIHESLTAVIESPRYLRAAAAEVTHMPGTHRHDRPNERNVRILESLRKEDGSLLPRWCFYLCQEYEVQGRQEEAIRTALEGVRGWQANRGLLQNCEAYELYVMLARWGSDPQAKLALLREAWAIEPWRREAVALMAGAYADMGNAKECLALARMTVSLPEPNERPWTHRSSIYRWGGIYLYTMAMRMNGMNSEADTLEEQMFRQSGSLISIIHPTLGRPEKAARVRSLFLERAKHPERVEYIFAYSADDRESAAILSRFRHVETPAPEDPERPTTVANANAAYAKSTGQIVIFAADDVEPPFWWDEGIVEQIGDPGQPAVLEVGDGHRKDGLLAHPVFTRSVPELLGLPKGEMFSSEYEHLFFDTEYTFRARKARLVRPSTVTFLHHHPLHEPVEFDATYARGNNDATYARSEATYRRRNPDAYGPEDLTA